MGNFYFLEPFLPQIAFGQRPDISFEELKSRLEINLSERDLEKVRKLQQIVDIDNVRSFLLEEEFDPRGNLTQKEMGEAFLVKDGLPSYVFDILDLHEKKQEKLAAFPAVLAKFLMDAIASSSGFLKSYFIFEREFRLVMLALRAKELGRDLLVELQYEDLTDPFVTQILAQRDAGHYEPPPEYAQLKELLISCGPDAWERHKAFTMYKYAKVEEMQGLYLFTLDVVLAYVVRFMLVEDWAALNQEKGSEVLGNCLKD